MSQGFANQINGNAATGENYMLDIGIGQNTVAKNSAGSNNVANSIRNMVRSALFLETLRNINWSRGYCWYAEMDGVPNPFQRGGVIGLPVKDISFKIAEGTTYSFNTSTVETLEVPQAMGNLGIVTMSLLDDEQQTLARFFERWYNQVYNPYNGVLPLTEACKQITIYKQKSTRRNVRRVYYNIDNNSNNRIGVGLSQFFRRGLLEKETEGYDFLVFPAGPLQFAWGTDANDLNTLQVNLTIAHFVNQDFGNPTSNNGILDWFGSSDGNVHGLDGRSWLDKLSNFI